MDLCEISTIKYIQKKFGFKNAKSLGQNFLTDGSVIEDMVNGAEISPEDLVIEIGPGIGVLTAALAETAGKVIGVELDKNLLPVLDFTLSGLSNVEIIHGDILKVDIENLIKDRLNRDISEGSRGIKIMGNLPYYITTPIITGLLEKKVPAESVTIMMQKEVAERVKAEPGSRTYGALSVAVQYRCDVEDIREVSKESFYPIPKVDSEVLKLKVLEKPKVKPMDEELFFRMVKAGFSQRRKTILNSLSTAGYSKDIIASCLKEVDIDEKRRAETLGLMDFCNISDWLKKNKAEN